MKSEPLMSEVLEVWISAELAEKIREHGVETYPYENAAVRCSTGPGLPDGARTRPESKGAAMRLPARFFLFFLS